MFKKFCLLLFGIIGGIGVSQAQLVREFRTPEKDGFEIVQLDFSTYKSSTLLKRTRISEPIQIHGHLEDANILPVFDHWIADRTLHAQLIHKNTQSDNLGRSITSKLFSSKNDFGHSWDIGLGSNYLYHLNFNLGVGLAEFDLANLPIGQLKIHSASADVLVHYGDPEPNRIHMDTLLVTLNMGTVQINDANFSNADKMIFEVNYGKINLNFSDGMASSCQIIAAVGAGSLYLKIPSESYPVRIKMKTTPMCRTSLPKFLKPLDSETYVTKGYSPDDPKLMDLTIDVGVGSLKVE